MSTDQLALNILNIDIAEILDISNQKEKEKFTEDFSFIFFSNLVEACTEKLDEIQKIKLSKLFDNEAETAKVLDFLKENTPDFEQILGVEILNIKEKALELII